MLPQAKSRWTCGKSFLHSVSACLCFPAWALQIIMQVIFFYFYKQTILSVYCDMRVVIKCDLGNKNVLNKQNIT